VVERSDGLEAEATGPVPTAWGWTETSLALMVFIWGINFAVVKSALASFNPLAFNAVRFAIASAFVLVVLAARGELDTPQGWDGLWVTLLGILGNVAYQMCFILGLSITPAGQASLLLALTPVTVTLLSTLLGHERPGARTWLGAVMSLVGVALVTGAGLRLQGSRALLGTAYLLGACVSWAIYTVGARGLVARYGSMQVTAWTMWVGTFGLIGLGRGALLHQRWTGLPLAAWGGLVFSAFFAIGLAYLIWYRGVERIGNTRTAIFSNLTPVVAMVAAALLLGERPGMGALLGGALTITGVMVVRSDRGRG
jgi:drug/metabolite transporter (DMT)-like permease